MEEVFSFVYQHLSDNQKVMLLTVIDRKGSSPGKQGFTMVVSSDGNFTGSIGGGIMEHKLSEKAKKLLQQDTLPRPFLIFQDHDPEATTHRSGMICSGGQTIAFTPLNKSQLSVIHDVLQSIQREQKGVLRFNEQGISFALGAEMNHSAESHIISEQKWEYRVQIGMPNVLYIFGGGHVGLALSQVFKPLGFKISIFDNRHGLNTMEENHFAHKKQIIDYRKVSHLVPDGFNIYVVIVTFAHKSDEQVLAQMIKKQVRYLGLMGSAKKIETIFDRLKEKGISPERLAQVHAPIGVPIHSETPFEIAISIAAEIISIKNEN